MLALMWVKVFAHGEVDEGFERFEMPWGGLVTVLAWGQSAGSWK